MMRDAKRKKELEKERDLLQNDMRKNHPLFSFINIWFFFQFFFFFHSVSLIIFPPSTSRNDPIQSFALETHICKQTETNKQTATRIEK